MRVVYERPIILSAELMAQRTFRAPLTRARSPGVHVQAVNRHLGKAAGKLKETEDSFADGQYPLLPALGVAWEEFRASHYSESELIWQPDELEREGLYGNTDGYWVGEDLVAHWECKLTSAKLKRIEDCWLYLKQGLSYCAMSGLVHVLYDVTSIYAPYKPEGKVVLVEFEEREKEAWWQNVKKAAPNVVSE